MSQNPALQRKSAYTADPNDLLIVGLDFEDEASALNDPRATWPVDEPLVLNIIANGVIEAITATTDGERLLVVDGRQRVKAARVARKRILAQGGSELRVPLLLRSGADARLMGVMVSANEHRRGTSLMAKAQLAQRLLDYGMPPDEVAIVYGVTRQSIDAWVKLLGASAKVKKAVDEGLMPPSAAIKLAVETKERQDEIIDALRAEGGKVSTDRAEVAVKQKNGKETSLRPPARLIRKVVARAIDEKTVLHEEAVAALQWVLGEKGKPAGLGPLLRKLEKSG